MKKWIIMALCLCLVISVTACSQRDDTKEPAISQSQPVNEGQSASQLSSGSPEDQTSQHGSAPIEEVLPLFEEKVKDEFGLDIQNTEPLGEISVHEDIWYKFRVTTEYETLVYLVNEDVNRIYTEMINAPISMQEVYFPVIEDTFLSVSDDQYEKLSESLIIRIQDNEGDGISGMHDGINIVCEEFCFVMTAAYIKDMDTTYVATYAISLDGERYYKLGDDGYFQII